MKARFLGCERGRRVACVLAANAFQIVESDSLGQGLDRDRANISDPIASLGFSLLDVARLYARRFQERARELALDLMQCRALLMLADNEGITQHRLAELVGVDPAALGRTLDRLETSGWVERRPHPGDRRARSLALTQQGRALVPFIGELAIAAQLAALNGFSTDEAHRLMTGLKQILANLRATESGAGGAPAARPQGMAS
jgi:MarR family transcriptional regulator, transcriptional regulator for hemolysin